MIIGIFVVTVAVVAVVLVASMLSYSSHYDDDDLGELHEEQAVVFALDRDNRILEVGTATTTTWARAKGGNVRHVGEGKHDGRAFISMRPFRITFAEEAHVDHLILETADGCFEMEADLDVPAGGWIEVDTDYHEHPESRRVRDCRKHAIIDIEPVRVEADA